MSGAEKTGVLVVHTGEPEKATKAAALPYLANLYRVHAATDRRRSAESVADAAAEYAEAAVGDLLPRLKKLGKGSPANLQAKKQARLVESAMRRRGHPLLTYRAGHLAGPSIADALAQARKDGVTRLVSLPVMTVCDLVGAPAALDEVDAWIAEEGWKVDHRQVTDWHRHPDYYRMHADSVLAMAHDRSLELHAPETLVVFAAVGTQLKYTKKGPRTLRYAQETAKGIARELGKKRWVLGFVNEGPADGRWSEPELSDVVAQALDEAPTERVVAVGLGSMVEGLHTGWSLDHELAQAVQDAGAAYSRAPLPHASGRFAAILADLVQDLLRPEPVMGELNLRRCLCRGTSDSFCLNAAS